MSINYNKTGDIIEIVERDASSAKVGRWCFNVNDKKLANRILSNLINKYGFSPEINPAESVAELEKKKADWLKMDVKL